MLRSEKINLLKVRQLVNGRYFSYSLGLFHQFCSSVPVFSPRNNERAIYIQTHPPRYVESKKWYKWTYSQNKSRVTDVENKLMDTRVEGGER